MDYGCTYKGMWSDITRTVFVGEPTEREKLVYNTVLAANLKGIEAAKKGAYIPDVEKAARDVIAEAGFGQYFTHRLGHGIGYVRKQHVCHIACHALTHNHAHHDHILNGLRHRICRHHPTALL